MTQLAILVLDVFHCIPTDVLPSIPLWIRPIQGLYKSKALVISEESSAYHQKHWYGQNSYMNKGGSRKVQ
jgi:hypothetical protein